MKSVKRYARMGNMAIATQELVKQYPEINVYVLASDYEAIARRNLGLVTTMIRLTTSNNELLRILETFPGFDTGSLKYEREWLEKMRATFDKITEPGPTK